MDGAPLISAVQERWNGWTEDESDGEPSQDDDGESDPEDSTYVYESEPDTDVSSDSDSEVSFHTVGSAEMLEIFETTVQGDSSDSDVESYGSEDEGEEGMNDGSKGDEV